VTARELAVSYWPAAPGDPLEDVTIGELLRRVAAEVPDRVALVDGQPDPAARRRFTYADVLAEAEAAARALARDLAPGDRLAVWAPNRPESAILQFAAALAGLVLVPVNPAYRADELRYVLGQSGASGIFHQDAYRGVSMTEIVQEVVPQLHALRVVMDLDEWPAFVAGAPATAELPTPTPADPFQIQYTSGTTGFAKGAVLCHHGAINASKYCAVRAGFSDGDTWVNPIPLFHVGGGVLGGIGTLACRGTHVVVPGFDPDLVLELLESESGSLVVAVPTMLIALLEHAERRPRRLEHLRTIMSGSTTVPAELVRRTKTQLGCDFAILFGQTEVHGVLTQTYPTDTDEDQAETIGQPLPHAEVKVANAETGEPVGIGEQGELCARGYQCMLGYYDMPEATAATIDGDGWLHTGDIGSMDARGYVRIQGRLKDLIIRGGENIHPREIEELLGEHAGVAEVAVLGIPDDRWGEQVGAVIRAADPERPPTVAELHAYCRSRLASFKTPKAWYFVGDFPLTASGKIQKFVLREQIATGELRPVTEPAEVAP
jgi:fatty-acyl-CoA synthase